MFESIAVAKIDTTIPNVHVSRLSTDQIKYQHGIIHEKHDVANSRTVESAIISNYNFIVSFTLTGIMDSNRDILRFQDQCLI